MSKLKALAPCPYCGNPDIARLGETPDALWCPKCCTQGPRDHWKGSSLSDIDAWNVLPRRLRWTSEKPTESGYYWYRRDGGHGIAGVYAIDGVLRIYIRTSGSWGNTFDEFYDGYEHVEWAGPIPKPQEE